MHGCALLCLSVSAYCVQDAKCSFFFFLPRLKWKLPCQPLFCPWSWSSVAEPHSLPCPPPSTSFLKHRGDARPPEGGSCSAAPVFKTICFGHGMFTQHFSHIRWDAPPSLRCGLHSRKDHYGPESWRALLHCWALLSQTLARYLTHAQSNGTFGWELRQRWFLRTFMDHFF